MWWWSNEEVIMTKEDRADVEQMVSAVARLCLWLVGELAPDAGEIVEIDLEQLERLLVQCETKFAKDFPRS